MNYYKPLEYIVPPIEDDWMLKTILQKRMHISRSLLTQLKQTEHGITLNGERQYISVKVKAYDRIEVRMQQEESEDILPQDLPLTIIYEDEHLLIVNKEAGMIVHPTQGHYLNTLANAVVYHWQKQGEKVRFRPIHRLDQETSGVLAIAKNPYVHQLVSEQMIARHTKKEYTALVYGVMAEDKGTVNASIDRDLINPHVRVVTTEGYPSITHYEVVQRFSQVTLVKLTLETGRTHQIRVHMKSLGHPLIGDKVYLQETSVHVMTDCLSIQRHALHAVKLGLTHPQSHQWVEFMAPLPEDMQNLISSLQLHED